MTDAGSVVSSSFELVSSGAVVSSSFELMSSRAALLIENVGSGVVFRVDLFVGEATPPRLSGNTSGLKYTHDRSTVAPVVNTKIAYL